MSVDWVILFEMVSKFLNCSVATTIVREILLGADDVIQTGIITALQAGFGIGALGGSTVRMSQLILYDLEWACAVSAMAIAF